MCIHLTSLVYRRQIGSAVRKSVLLYMADKASEDGTGIWASKTRIAKETEVSLATVKRCIREFLSEGILTAAGTKPSKHGDTIDYTLNIAVLEGLEIIRTTISAQRGSERTGVTVNRGHSEPGSGRPDKGGQGEPNGGQGDPQTIKNHNKNHQPARAHARDDGGGAKVIDEDFLEQLCDAMALPNDVGQKRLRVETERDELARWSDLGLTEAQQLAVVGSVMDTKDDPFPPNSFRYFTKAMEREAAGEGKRKGRKAPMPPKPDAETVDAADRMTAGWIRERKTFLLGNVTGAKARDLIEAGLITEAEAQTAGVL